MLTRWRIVALFAATVLGVLIGTLSSQILRRNQALDEPPASSGGAYASIGGPFTLTDHEGNRVTEKSYAGKIQLVFFGFTYCPDVCPTTLNDIAGLLEQLGDRVQDVQPLFITVDPERDTVDLLASYVTHFHPSIVGLTGTPEEIAQAARAFRVYYRKAPGTAEDNYSMEHTASTYVMDRQGRFRGTLDPHEPADTRLAKMRRLLDEPVPSGS